MPLLDAVRTYARGTGPLASCSYTTLHALASIVYDRYMTNQAHDEAKYDSTWDSESNPTKYGPKVPNVRTPEDTRSDPDWTGDAVLRNETSFLRSTSRYLEFCDAVAVGDPGRMFEVLKVCSATRVSSTILSISYNNIRFYGSPSGEVAAPTMAMSFSSSLAISCSSSRPVFAPPS